MLISLIDNKQYFRENMLTPSAGKKRQQIKAARSSKVLLLPKLDHIMFQKTIILAFLLPYPTTGG
jgi:hypothetical protein